MSTNASTARQSARILVVDDHPVVRQGLVLTLGRQEGFQVCAEAEDLPGTLRAIHSAAPNVILVDLDLDGASGLDVIKAVREQHPDMPILVLSVHHEDIYAERALRAGARGYLMKNANPETIVAGIRTVLSGEVVLSDRMKQKILANLSGTRSNQGGMDVDRLSDRELQVFRLVGDGMSTRQMAQKLSLSVKTIEAHLAHLKRKLGADSGKDLQRRAFAWAAAQETQPRT